MSKLLTGFQQTVFDAVANKDASLSEAVRDKIKEVCGGEWNYYKFLDNKNAVFEIISDMMPVAMQAGLQGKFDKFAEFVDTAMGDENTFTVEDNKLYQVYTLARGDGDVKRDKIVDRRFTVPTKNKEIKLYAELDELMSGKITLDRMTDKALNSYINHVGLLISDVIYNSYTAVGTPYKATGAFDADTLVGIIENVKAATGAEAVEIWGTTQALSNITDGFGYSDKARDFANNMGYYDTFRGADMYQLPQAFLPGTETFAVNTNYVIVLPADEKIAKVAFEGAPIVGMVEALYHNDRTTDIIYGRRVGAAAITVIDGGYGLYRFS